MESLVGSGTYVKTDDEISVIAAGGETGLMSIVELTATKLVLDFNQTTSNTQQGAVQS